MPDKSDKNTGGKLFDRPTMPNKAADTVRPDDVTMPGPLRMATSEKVRNYLIGIGALTGLILGLLAQFKGEPVAEKAWSTLREQVNRQSEAINDIHTEMAVLRAIQDARTTFILESELEALQNKYDALLEEEGAAEEVEEGPPQPSCPAGRVRGSDGKCRFVPAPVAAKMKPVKKQVASNRKELEEERRRRQEAEGSKKDLMRKMLDRDRMEQKPLEALPRSLDEASM